MVGYVLNVGEQPEQDAGQKRLEGRIHDARETTTSNGASPIGNTSV